MGKIISLNLNRHLQNAALWCHVVFQFCVYIISLLMYYLYPDVSKWDKGNKDFVISWNGSTSIVNQNVSADNVLSNPHRNNGVIKVLNILLSGFASRGSEHSLWCHLGHENTKLNSAQCQRKVSVEIETHICTVWHSAGISGKCRDIGIDLNGSPLINRNSAGVHQPSFQQTRTDLDKSSWIFFSGAYVTILCCTETYHNLTRYFTTTLVLMFWISQAYAIASCTSAHFCDVAYAL